ncbi:MAG TPA: hypothetical protein VJZ76_20590 [Thermoanaerobaculia bacterium]|nr:hypothetical protein [Thermoanaerobaculia bacterium]
MDIDLFRSLRIIETRKAAIERRTAALPLWRPPLTAVFGFAEFLEDQWRAMCDQVQPSASLFPQKFLGDTLSLSDGRSAPIAIHDELVEAFQVVLAFVEDHENRSLLPTSMPVLNVTMVELAHLAELWRAYEMLRQNVIYLSWRASAGDDGSITFAPTDRGEYRLIEVGKRRREEQVIGAATIVLSHLGMSDRFRAAVKRAAASITLPEPLSVWDGEIDREALEVAYEHNPLIVAAESTIRAFFYEPIAAELTIGEANIAWSDVHEVLMILRTLAAVFEVKFDDMKVSAGPILVSLASLTSIVADVLDLSLDVIQHAIEFLIFARSPRELELWDTPLIRIDRERLLFQLRVVGNGMPFRQLENFATAWNRNLFDGRGKALEAFLASLFSLKEIPTQECLRFGDAKTECDLVVWWQGWLILIEAKCTKSVFSAVDAHRARAAAEEAAEQLELRRRLLLKNWQSFRAAARDLSLPEAPVAVDRLALIAVLNVPHFSTHRVGDVIITDDMLLQRFFSDPEIVLSENGEPVATLGAIRPSGDVTPEMLLDYLRNPIQVRLANAALEEQTMWLPAVDEQPAVATTYTTYRPILPELASNILERLHSSDLYR